MILRLQQKARHFTVYAFVNKGNFFYDFTATLTLLLDQPLYLYHPHLLLKSVLTALLLKFGSTTMMLKFTKLMGNTSQN